MKTKKSPALGDRIDFGGKKPQLDAFAAFVYQAMLDNSLDWIKVGDIDAATLDDIQYSTKSEIHAYQVKWSNKEVPTPFSYKNFFDQLQAMVEGWRSLKSIAISEHKTLKIHLLTNRAISQRDSIKNAGKIVGTFKDFYNEVWKKLKSEKTFPSKWNTIVNKIKKETQLSNQEFVEFLKAFEFNPGFILDEFRSSSIGVQKRDEDIITLSRFFLEQLAEKKQIIKFSFNELLHKLPPIWESRFKTIFNHELVVDKKRYQPIVQTSSALDDKISLVVGGYIFLMGGPGSGKSTLLTEWSKKQSGTVIRYYTFDFTNPSSAFNYSDRGESISLFYDLVLQIDQKISRGKSTLIHKDLNFLKATFADQLLQLGNRYTTTGEKALIVIDGLDHIPREYANASKNFLRDLPHPGSIPEGVYIILGSQSFMLEDLSREIKSEWTPGQRSIHIVGLDKKAVQKYVTSCKIKLDSVQNEKLFKNTNGHPLYLSYLVAKMLATDDIDTVLEEAIVIEGNIDIYYNKIWEPIRNNEDLQHLLALVARINGNINPHFIGEWNISKSTQTSFKQSAKYLFDESGDSWSFFHNSFRLFIINDSSTNDITEKFDFSLEKEFHLQLSRFYTTSKAERSWKGIYHLYRAKEYDEFLKIATPEQFSEQFVRFRPYTEIRRDIELGIHIANERKDSSLLVKYLFAIAELDKRIFNASASSFIEELIQLGLIDDAKNNLRAGNSLLCDEATALKAANLFFHTGDKTESYVLFALAEPDFISESGITIASEEHSYYRSEKLFQEWGNAALLFYDLDKLLTLIKNTKFNPGLHIPDSATELKLRLLFNCTKGLAKLHRWSDYEKVLQKLKKHKNYFLHACGVGIRESLGANNLALANQLLDDLLMLFNKKEKDENVRVFIAELIYSVKQDTGLVKEWIEKVAQPSIVDQWEMSDKGLNPFSPKIRLNRLLNLCGLGVSPTVAVPDLISKPDQRIMVEFERILCLIARIQVDGIQKINFYEPIEKRIKPIIEFYYQDIPHRNTYSYNLNRVKADYYEYLVDAVSHLNSDEFHKVATYLFKEFKRIPEYWLPEIQRKIILAFIERGLGHNTVKEQLEDIQNFMLSGKDVSGRIDECYQQARAWIQIGEKNKALKLIADALTETLGIGYRKDYQFNTWLTWLRKMNELNPESSESRILWFLSKIEHIKEVTEGDAFSDAADGVLQTTFQWNLSAGLKQMKWQLDKGLASFQDSLNIFMGSCFNKVTTFEEFENLLGLYTDLFLLISTYAQTTLLRDILVAGNRLCKEASYQRFLHKLIASININALQETRFSLLKEIEDFTKSNSINIENMYPGFAVPTPPRSYSRNNSSDSSLVLSSGESLRQNEVKAKIKEYQQLKFLIEGEVVANSYFKWEDIFKDMSFTLTIDQIKELSQIGNVGRRESTFYTTLSHCAFKLGAFELAEELARKAISLASASGWMKPYDGGTKVTGFTALKNIDKDKGKKEAFESFCEDVLNSNYAGSFIEYLNDVLPLLDEDWSIDAVWKELSSYLSKLLHDSVNISDLPQLKKENRSINSLLVELLIYLAKYPVSFISDKAEQLLADVIETGDNELHAQLNSLLNMDPAEQEILVNVYMNIKVRSKNMLLNFSEQLSLLATSKNYLVRRYSAQILRELNLVVPSVAKVDVAKLYTLKLATVKGGNFRSINPKDQIGGNPYALIAPYNTWLGLLEKATGIQRDIIYYRWVKTMHDLESESRWDSDYEEGMRLKLSEVGLKYRFVRPKTKIAFRSFCYLLAELVDGNLLPPEHFEYVFRTQDFESALFKESMKPEFIQSLKSERHSRTKSDWFEFEDCQRLNENILPVIDEVHVIGEYTLVRSLDWGLATEIYMSQISVQSNNNDDYIFGSAFEVLVNEYYTIAGLEPNIIIIRDHRFHQFDIKSNWIAINPSLANILGWIPDETEMFGWKNDLGEKMVYSKFWRNGNVEMRPPHLESEAGEGWMVLASSKAIQEIRGAVSVLQIEKSVTRSKYEERQETERKVTATFPF